MIMMMMMMTVSCDHDSDDDDGSVTFHFLSSPLIISILAEEKQVRLILRKLTNQADLIMGWWWSIYVSIYDDDKDDGSC